MNRFIVVLSLLWCSFVANAQFDRETIFCSGFGAYSYQKYDGSTENDKQRTMLGNMAVGFFPAKKLMVGITSGVLAIKDESKTVYETSPFTLTEWTDTKSSSFTLGPIARYYVVRGFHFEASYVAGKSKMNENYESYQMIGTDLFQSLTTEKESKASVNGFTAGIGYSIFLDPAKRLALDVGISYQQHKLSDTKYSGMAAGFGISGFIVTRKAK